MNNKNEIIKRLKVCKEKNKNFYLRYPELLESLELKIKALESDNYKIVNSNWIIPYIGSKLRSTLIGLNDKILKNDKFISIDECKNIVKEIK